MKKEWFEPGPYGESPFVRKYNASPGTAGEAVAAAFRALLAGEDGGRTADAKDAKDAEIAELRESLERSRLALNTTRQQRDQFWSQRDAARAEVERLKNECSDQQSYVLDLESAIARKDTRIKVLEVANDSLTQYSSILTAERDALRARIDAGVRAWEKWKQQCGSLWLWAFPGATASQAWSDVCDALDADYVVYPIDQPVDERKGERRKVIPARIRRDGFDYSMDYDTPWMTNRRKYDRRRTAGTIADRGKAS